MIRIYVYDKASGLLIREDFGLADYVMNDIKDNTDFTLVPPPDYNHVWRWVDTKWEEAPPIEPHLPPLEDRQAEAWEGIKTERLKQTTSGVYVPSVDKVFHTDDVSVIQYNNIGNMIALDNFEPIQWKVMDNTWITMTEEVFRDLQTAMVQNTNRIYQVSEEHKAKMMESDNPDEYDYSSGWNGTDSLNKDSK